MKKLIMFMLLTTAKTLIACDYDLDVPPLVYTLTGNPVIIPKTLELERDDNSGPCAQYFLGFTRGWAPNYNRYATNLSNGNKIYYNLYKNAGGTQVLKNPSDITSNNDVLMGQIAKNEELDLTYYFSVSPYSSATLPRAGTYVDYVQVQAYSGKWWAINSYEGYKNIAVQIIVPKMAAISLVDTGASFDPADTYQVLDFGELEQNEQMSFDLMVVSNAGYSVTFSSNNLGVLKNTTVLSGNNTIQYELYVNNTLRNLSSSTIVANGAGTTPSSGNRIPVRVKIKNVDNKEPGTYSDYITITTTTTE
ncbi:MAG: spore coat U domain-containing protein [Bacteriovoracaceae bacterium]|nr:spore coat U domain-containing protein [Bacteriovoracaceae bacterium]